MTLKFTYLRLLINCVRLYCIKIKYIWYSFKFYQFPNSPHIYCRPKMSACSYNSIVVFSLEISQMYKYINEIEPVLRNELIEIYVHPKWFHFCQMLLGIATIFWYTLCQFGSRARYTLYVSWHPPWFHSGRFGVIINKLETHWCTEFVIEMYYARWYMQSRCIRLLRQYGNGDFLSSIRYIFFFNGFGRLGI